MPGIKRKDGIHVIILGANMDGGLNGLLCHHEELQYELKKNVVCFTRSSLETVPTIVVVWIFQLQPPHRDNFTQK